MTDRSPSFRELFDELPAPVWVADPQGRVEWRNATAETFSGMTMDQIAADTYVSIHPDDRAAVERFLGQALAAGEPFETEFRSMREGDYRWVVLRARPVRDEAGSLLRWVAIVTDIDEQRRELTVLETMFSEVPAGLVFADPQLRLVRINRFGALWRSTKEESLIGRTLDEIWPNVWSEVEPLYRRALESAEATVGHELSAEWPTSGGEMRHWLLSVYPVRVRDEFIGVGSIAIDVTAQKRAELRLQYLADHDPLTGIFNRRRLIEELDRHMRYAVRSRRSGAVLVFDVDHLKLANDTYGHATGDAIIRAVSDVLTSRTRQTDVVARQGGDEFTVILPEASRDDALLVARDVRQLLSEQRVGPPIMTSVGIALFTGKEEITADEILVCADTALYEAKERGGNQARVYIGQASGALTWVQRIRAALSEDRFVVFAQPIIDLRTGSVARHELLIRMQGTDGDLISPATFIPTAERFGLIHEVDRWVITKGLAVARRGRPVSINLSGYSIGEEQVIALVKNAIDGGLDPRSVTFEITETAAMTNFPLAREFADSLTALGCGLALDDFGTGFGSFAYLKHIPARALKIDIEFVRNVVSDETDQQVIKAIVAIARSLGKVTVAEGVEDAATLSILREFDVDYAQGYFLGRPALLPT